ncbi:hypothetical protein [Waltera intestinalis]|nr:hypothetical protein [Waltera intestinalis]
MIFCKLIYWINNQLHHRTGYRCFCPTCPYFTECRQEQTQMTT